MNEVTLEHDSLLQDLQSEARARPALSRFAERELLSINYVVIVQVMDQSLQDLSSLEVIIQRNELNPAPHCVSPGGSRLELGALGAACCAALVALAVFAPSLLCTLVQMTSVLTWGFGDGCFCLLLLWRGQCRCWQLQAGRRLLV